MSRSGLLGTGRKAGAAKQVTRLNAVVHPVVSLGSKKVGSQIS